MRLRPRRCLVSSHLVIVLLTSLLFSRAVGHEPEHSLTSFSRDRNHDSDGSLSLYNHIDRGSSTKYGRQYNDDPGRNGDLYVGRASHCIKNSYHDPTRHHIDDHGGLDGSGSNPNGDSHDCVCLYLYLHRDRGSVHCLINDYIARRYSDLDCASWSSLNCCCNLYASGSDCHKHIDSSGCN